MRHFIAVPFAIISVTAFPRRKYVPDWASANRSSGQVKMRLFKECQAYCEALTNRLDDII